MRLRILVSGVLVAMTATSAVILFDQSDRQTYVISQWVPSGYQSPVIGERVGPRPASPRKSRSALFKNLRSGELIAVDVRRSRHAPTEYASFVRRAPKSTKVVETTDHLLLMALRRLDEQRRTASISFQGLAIRRPDLVVTLHAQTQSPNTLYRIVESLTISSNGEPAHRGRLPKNWVTERSTGEGGFVVDLHRTVVYEARQPGASPVWITTLRQRPPDLDTWRSESLGNTVVWWDPTSSRAPACRAAVLVSGTWALIRGCLRDRAETGRWLASLHIADTAKLKGVTRQPIYAVADLEVAGTLVAEGRLVDGHRWREIRRSPLFHDVAYGDRVVGLVGVPGAAVIASTGDPRDLNEVGWIAPAINISVVSVRASKSPRLARARSNDDVVEAMFVGTADLAFQYAFLLNVELSQDEAKRMVVETAQGTIRSPLPIRA